MSAGGQGGSITIEPLARVEQESRREKRQRQDADGGFDLHQNSEKVGDTECNVPNGSQIAVSRPIRVPSSEGCDSAFVTRSNAVTMATEFFPLRRIANDNLDSYRQLIELSRLASFSPSSSIVHSLYPNVDSIFSWPVNDLPRLPYQPILGLGRSDHRDRSFPNSPFNGVNSLNVMLSSLKENAVGSRPSILPRDLRLMSSKEIGPLQESGPKTERASMTVENRMDSTCLLSSSSSKMVNGLPKVTRASRPPNKRRKAEKRGGTKLVPGTTLYTPTDDERLNENQVFLRKQIEVFCATEDDLLSLTRGKNKPLLLQQVGIRCRFCSQVPVGRRGKGATYFPSNLLGLYQAAQNLHVEHFQSGVCTELPPDVRNRYSTPLPSGKPSASGAGKKYWAESAGSLGLVDTADGIRFAADLR